DVFLEKIDAMEERHAGGVLLSSQAGTYAPIMGVLGAVVGLIAALGITDHMDVLGAAISAVFIATLFVIFTGYVLCLTIVNKLKQKSKEEVSVKNIMVEGISSITAGESPAVIRDKLSSFLSSKEYAKMTKATETED